MTCAQDKMHGGGVSGRLSRRVGVVLGLPIRAYRFAISPMLPPSCRFYPSCSEYALEAIGTFGPLTGGWLAARRLCRCHPWNAGGLDPVPPRPVGNSLATPQDGLKP